MTKMALKLSGFGIAFLCTMNCTSAQDTTHFDPTAILILDRMSDVIGDMKSCTFQTVVSYDVVDPDYGLIKKFLNTEVFMQGPDKMVINLFGPNGHRQCWYNGTQFAIYDYEEKNYGIVPAPATLIGMIDSIHTKYNIDFPAADFFYPAFTDDILESNGQLAFIGKTNINGRECFHIMAKNKTTTSQMWVSNDAYNLPVRYVISYDTQPGSPQYDLTFYDWKVNPDLPLSMFNFLPPPGTHEVRLMSVDDK
jgi:hypothetical protein